MAGENDELDTGVDTSSDLDRMLDEFTGQTSGRSDGTESGTQQTDKTGKTTQDTNQGGQGRQGTQDGTRQTTRSRGGQQDADAQGQGADGADTRRPIQQAPRQFGSLFRSDTSGAIISADGRKIAAPGLERRVFERMHSIYSRLEMEHAANTQKLEAYESANQAAKNAGLSLEEHSMGLRLVAAWKQDKVQTIKFLLNEASKAGIDVSSIQGGGVDMAALQRMFDERVSEALKPFMPFVQNSEQQRELENMRSEAAQQLSEFYEEFPHAQQHAGVLADIMERTGYSMREALFALQASAAQHGWDMSKPLQPQAAATQQRAGGNSDRRPTGAGNQRLPAMNGRDSGNGSTVRAGSRAPAAADSSWDSIIADVASEHGVDLG